MSAVLNEPVPEAALPFETDAEAFPQLPRLIEVEGVPAPRALEELDDAGVDPMLLIDLMLKAANTIPSFTTEWASEKIHLPMQLVDTMCWRLKDEKLIEILGENGPFSYRYAITGRGREHAHRLLDFCGYVGPAPVSLEAYTAMLEWQIGQRSPVTSQDIRAALSKIILTEEAVQVAELAISSGRSLFLFGPAGNGKTSLGRLLHNAIRCEVWIPYCINVDGSIVRLFDSQSHQAVDGPFARSGKIDRRWVRIQRPFIVSGGEMTIEALDLSYSPSVRFYEAPLHIKANGGTFLIDDFGRQRVNPEELLNRWIIPLEHQIDHLTLKTGQKIEVPFKLMLVVATNLTVEQVADPAFLRRMGYRLHVDKPSPERYTKIFQRYAADANAPVEPGLIERLLKRYEAEGRDLRSSEPRDLIERARDICRLHGLALELNQQIMNLAWTGYFGNM